MGLAISKHPDAFDYKLTKQDIPSVQENDYLRVLLQMPFDADRVNLILFLNHEPALICQDKLDDFLDCLDQKNHQIWQETLGVALEKGIRFNRNIGDFMINGASIGRGYIVTIEQQTALQEENKALKESLKSLSERADTFKAYCDIIQAPFWIRDQDLELLFANQTLLKIVGTQNLMTLKQDNLWLCNAAKADILARLAIEKNDVQFMDITYIKDHQTVFGTISETPVTNDDGEFFLFGSLTDTTKEKELSQRVAHLESGIQEILTNISIAASLFDHHRRLRFYNKAFADLWGLETSYLDTAPDHLDILDKLRANRLLPENRNFKQWRSEIFAPYQDINGFYEEIWHTPQQKTLKCTVSPYANGGVVCLQEDVTDYIALEQSYTVMTNNLRNTLNALEEGILLCDINGKIKVHNLKMAEIFDIEIDPQNYLKTHLTAVLENTPADSPLALFIHQICHFIRSGFPEEQKHTQECTIEDIIYTATMMRLSSGDILIYIRDETAILNYQKMLQFKSDTLKENEHIRESFFRRISHNLRNPMTAIAGFAEMLETEIFGKLNEKQSEYISDMRSSVKDLLQITDNLAELVRLDTNIAVNFQQVDLKEMIIGAIHAMQSEASRRNMTIEHHIDQNISIQGDEALMRQSLIQIFENAVFYTPRNTTISVNLETTDTQAIIHICDQGKGLDDDTIMAFNAQDIHNIKGYGLRYVLRICALHHAQCHAAKLFDDQQNIIGTKISLGFSLGE